MLSLKFVRSLATKLIDTSSILPTVAADPLAFSHETQQNNQEPIKHARPLSTSPILALGATNLASSRGNKSKMALLGDQLGLPLRPKRPIIPWIAFMRERKDRVLSQKQNMSAPEMAVILAREWKLVDKSRYEQEYNRRREEYQRQVENFENSLNDKHRDLIDIQKDIAREDKASRVIRRTKPPKLPRNPVNLYILEKCQQPDIKEQLKTRKASEVLAALAKEYTNLDESIKARYVAKQKDDVSRFQKEFQIWYDGVRADKKMSKTALKQADLMYKRFKALKYI